ncbi:DoxX family protein [Rothia terrae]|uniref:DoxX family protein n=2 Tax=Rothia terrae TaxID=396015 RepID=UPI00380D92EE
MTMSTSSYAANSTAQTSGWKRLVTLDYLNHENMRSFGLLILRLGTLAIFLHGWHKLHGYQGIVKFLGTAPVGELAPQFFGFLVVAGQLLLGIALALGIFTRWSSLWLACMFAFIILAVNIPTNGLISEQGGLSFEPVLFYFVPGLVLFFTGAGKFSLDYLLVGRHRHSTID